MTAEKTRARITQDATERAAPYLGSPDSEVIGQRCCRCSDDMTAGGIYYGGDERHQAGRYCGACADTVAFWPCIDGDYDTGGECERCGVIVTEADACYLMAEVSCPACFAATFTDNRITTTQRRNK